MILPEIQTVKNLDEATRLAERALALCDSEGFSLAAIYLCQAVESLKGSKMGTPSR